MPTIGPVSASAYNNRALPEPEDGRAILPAVLLAAFRGTETPFDPGAAFNAASRMRGANPPQEADADLKPMDVD